MAKTLVVVFPKLEAKRAYNGHTTKVYAELLGMSEDSVRRRLRGEVEFELSEIIKLMAFYHCTFEELFGTINENNMVVSC